MEKMTVKELFEEVKGIVANAEIEEEQRMRALAFLETRIAQVTAKNSKRSDKPTKAQVENDTFANAVMEVMPAGQAMTASQVQKIVPALAELSNQRVTSILRVLINRGQVERTEEKGKAFFTRV